ncbi:sodium/proton antiporter NhaB [Rheinheimera riviphila]|uniref:Na(+)/H(+) antiporter NhaB n=1 Tax=Rheinheimera riviphila TaxID=1834037 RepID=A0A437R543_9GAMM|nr:sodium/proton antiporter NhaB [Rheinheimera riviphila]RVU41896.1 sodium/proton antiporter NhaB [Rheinheimera riviphila]
MKASGMALAIYTNFLGQSPNWYKLTIIAFLFINPIVFINQPYLAGWLLVIEFIFTLAMALKCYPLQPGGLITLQAIAMGMTSTAKVMHEVTVNVEVILLLVFMVAGIHFVKDLLLFVFTKLLIRVRSKIGISLAFAFMSAFLSAFLDALTVVAVIIAVVVGFYAIYHKISSGKGFVDQHDPSADNEVAELSRSDLDAFRGFLRNLLMHAGVGTALGGVSTMVGEPQNLIIAAAVGWDFAEFALRMAAVSAPVLIAGLLTTVAVEKFKLFDFGIKLPEAVQDVLIAYDNYQTAKLTTNDVAKLWVQGIIAVLLILCLSLHIASVGLIGLMVIVLATTFCGVTDEHAIGNAFKEALPFTALLVVFFAVVAVIIDQHLFTPVISWVLTFDGQQQLAVLFLANGLLSTVSDNVFVGTVYINEVKAAWEAGKISREQFELLAIAINTGTNLPSVATPNGQAAFLFLLTSALAPLIRLSYVKMVWMALPYTIVLTIVGLFCTAVVLPEATQWLYQMGWIEHYVPGAAGSVGH